MPPITAATLLTLVLTALLQLLLIAAFALLNMTNQIAPLVPPAIAALRDVMAAAQIIQKLQEFAKKIAQLPALSESPMIPQQLRQAAL